MTSRLTPRFESIEGQKRIGDYVSVDIGLWPGKTDNKKLCVMPYYQGRGMWHPPAFDPKTLDEVATACKNLWKKHCCKKCEGNGCGECGETGWNRYKEWQAKGGKIDKKTNYPIL